MWKATIVDTGGSGSVPKIRIKKIQNVSNRLKKKAKKKKKKANHFVFSTSNMRPAPERPGFKLSEQTRINMNWNIGKQHSKWFFLTTAQKKIFLTKGLNYFGSSARDNIQIVDNRISKRELSIYIPHCSQIQSCTIKNIKGNCIVNGIRMEFHKEQALFNGDSVTIKSEPEPEPDDNNKKLIHFLIFKKTGKKSKQESDYQIDNHFSSIVQLLRINLRNKANILELPNRIFLKNFRLNKETFVYILGLLDLPPGIRSTHIPPMLQLAATLNLLRGGGYQQIGADWAAPMGQSTVAEISASVIKKMQSVLCPLLIKFELLNFLQLQFN